MVIGLNAGHTLSGPGSGAVGVLKESAETRRVCKRVTELLSAAGVEVRQCTVDKAATQSAYLQEVVKMANSKSLDWFVSIHFNNDAAKKGQGVEVYTYGGRQYPDAVEVCRNIAALGFRNRGVKSGSGLYVIRKSQAKSMLIEVCFVNEPDASKYEQKFEDVCRAIVRALATYVKPDAEVPQPSKLPEKQRYVKVLYDGLSVRKMKSWDSKAICGTVKENEVFTVVDGPITVGNGKMYRLKSGVYITASEQYVHVYEK